MSHLVSRILLPIIFLLGVLILPVSASTTQSQPTALTKIQACIYSPLGASGPVYQMAKDFQIKAKSYGVETTLKPYTSERVAAEDFKSGVCDYVVLTGIRSRQFNPFIGSLDSYGAIENYDQLKTVITKLLSAQASKLMVQGDYEVSGILPGGATYLFVNDKKINSADALAGKRFAYLESDPGLKLLVQKVGASPVSSTIETMYSQFNNGSVDVVFGPAIVYEALELYKGIGDQGGIIKVPASQLTMQAIMRHEKFPDGFGQISRDFFLSQYDQVLKTIQSAEQAIDPSLWIDLEHKTAGEFSETLRQARIFLRDQGFFDGKMLALLRKMRCQKNPANFECSAQDRE